MSLLEHLDRFNPILCRMLARKNGHRIKVDDLAAAVGVTRRTIIRLSKQKSWNGVSVGTASRFMSACGIDPFHLGSIRRFVRKAVQDPGRTFDYLPLRTRRYLASLDTE
jgi:hypothetical protein